MFARLKSCNGDHDLNVDTFFLLFSPLQLDWVLKDQDGLVLKFRCHFQASGGNFQLAYVLSTNVDQNWES